MIENPLVLGTIVFVLVYLIRKLDWETEGLKAMWLTMIVSLGIALFERIIKVGIPGVLVCEMVSEPAGALTCLLAILQAIVQEAGVVFVAAQVIYQILRRAILKERI